MQEQDRPSVEIVEMLTDGTSDEEIVGAIMEADGVGEGYARIILAGLRDPSIYTGETTAPE